MSAADIRALRLALGLTQERFGRLFHPPVLGITVSRWERGTRRPERYNQARLERLAKRVATYRQKEEACLT